MREKPGRGAMLQAVMAIVAGALLLWGCAPDMEPYQVGSAASPRKVLVAAQDSEFKRAVVRSVVEELGTEEWHFRIVGLDRLAGADLGQYGAILLVCRYSGGQLDRRVRAFLELDPENAKAVLFFTCGVDDPPPSLWERLGLRIDAVSSASRDDRVEVRASQIAALLGERF